MHCHWCVASGNVTKCVDQTLLHIASPYLFPFVLEYSLIALATFGGMFASLDVAVSKDFLKAVKKVIQRAKNNSKKGNVKANDHHNESTFAKAHMGLFLGMLVLAGMVVSIVLFFYWSSVEHIDEDEPPNMNPTLMFHGTDLGAHVLMFIAVIVGFAKFFRLGFSLTRWNTIDHALLLISLAGVILFETFMMISSFTYITEGQHDGVRTVSIVACASGLVAIFQSLFQTIFIIDGMQRYSSNVADQKTKPGRGAVTFLVITNLSLWMYKSFQVKQISIDRHSLFYGSSAWAIILNINLPLTVFYRFHSSVCLADMWFAAYEPEEEMPMDMRYLE